jgi:hypothetical protein
LPTALATERGVTLASVVIEELRARRILTPPIAVIERLCGEVRYRAQRQLWRALTEGLSGQQSAALDGLLEIRPVGGQSSLAWLRQTAYAATPRNFPKLIERLRIVRTIGIEPERTARIHQNHWLKLARPTLGRAPASSPWRLSVRKFPFRVSSSRRLGLERHLDHASAGGEVGAAPQRVAPRDCRNNGLARRSYSALPLRLGAVWRLRGPPY